MSPHSAPLDPSNCYEKCLVALYSFGTDMICMSQSELTSDGDVAGDADGPSLKDISQVIVRLYSERRHSKSIKVLPDLIWTAGAMYFVLSSMTKEVINRCRVGDEVGFIPTTIQDSKGNVRSDDYWFMYSSRECDIADYERSDVSWCDGIPVSVRKWVVNSKKIPPFDLFYASPNDWFASEDLKQAFEINDIGGLQSQSQLGAV